MFPLQSANTPSGYFLNRSLRFRASASPYLNRTFTTPTNANKWTMSFWFKRGNLSTNLQCLYSAGVLATDAGSGWLFFSGDTLYFGSSVTNWRVTTQVFRDPSAWYHLVIQFDSTQATAANRILMYLNGAQITSFSTSNNPTQNTNIGINTATPNYIGQQTQSIGLNPFDGYYSEFNFIDGQALTPSSFGSTNATTGVWQPAPYTGTYGTNGFYLPFTDNSALTTSSNVGLGKDFSGNGNYWTTNNISITSGVTYDSMTDVPTLTSTTAANYCVLSPVDNSSNGVQVVLTGGNLDLSLGSGQGRATFSVSSGKWYWEMVSGATNQGMYGIIKQSVPIASATFSSADGYFYWATNGSKYNNGSGTAYGSGLVSGDVLGIAFDASAGTLTYYKNGVSLGTAFSGLSGTFAPAFCQGNTSATASFNFGQRPFAYTPPSGFVALNAYNLPSSTISKGSDNMNISLDTGANIKTSTEALFSGSQFIEWIKDRANSNNYQLLDSVRGLTSVLQTNSTAPATTYVAPSGSSVGWAWKAGTSSSTNTAGTVSATVSVNPSAGISMGTFTVPASGSFTVGHGLGVAPKFIIAKAINATYAWVCYHVSATANNYLVLSATAPATANSGAWGNTTPTSSVITFGDAAFWQAGANYVFYAFAEVAGFSSFGSYLGNGSADGPFIYKGFRPRFELIKNISASESWNLHDTSRSPYNQDNNTLFPNDSSAEYTGTVDGIDDLSNGTKIRNTGTQSNQSGATMIYVSFAENPFKNSLAR
jgi:hypothetical protein